jgi:hypothetical protein
MVTWSESLNLILTKNYMQHIMEMRVYIRVWCVPFDTYSKYHVMHVILVTKP